MADAKKLGRCVIEKAHILPSLDFDMTQGVSTQGMGQTFVPVVTLPPLEFEMNANAAPLLELALKFRGDAPAAQIGRDCHRLFVLLNEADLAHGGNGLLPVTLNETDSTSDVDVTLAFRAINANNATVRFQEIARVAEQHVRELHSIQSFKVKFAA